MVLASHADATFTSQMSDHVCWRSLPAGEGHPISMMDLRPDPCLRPLMARRAARGAGLVAILGMASIGAVPASSQTDEKIENRVAIFSALDKVTATIRKLEVPIGETAEFGALKVTPRTCYTRPPTLQPKTTSFVEVDEVQLDGDVHRIFGGWMFAESPGLNAVEHPVFDVWLTDCAGPRSSVAQHLPPPGGEAAQESGAADAYDGYDAYDAPEEPRRRVRR